jgi:hypothetical protein
MTEHNNNNSIEEMVDISKLAYRIAELQGAIKKILKEVIFEQYYPNQFNIKVYNSSKFLFC